LEDIGVKREVCAEPFKENFKQAGEEGSRGCGHSKFNIT
jgi:hypothetical protein